MMLLGKNLKDDHEEGVYSGPDPLGNARKDLDFAALAAGAPAVKSILFKAQTMGPLPRTRPGGKTVGGAVAGVVLLAMLLVPWVPLHSSILAIQMGFEKDLTRREAAELYSEMLKQEPPRTVLSSSFSPIAGGDEDAQSGGKGHLRINATAFDTSRGKLEERLRQLVIVHGSGGLEPMFSQSALAESTSYTSPLGLLVKRVQRSEQVYVGAQPEDSPAQSATRHSEQIARGLEQRLSSPQRAVQVTACRFLSPVQSENGSSGESADKVEYDFVLPTWPAPLGLKVQPYADLTAAEQSGLRQGAEAYMGSLGLSRSDGPQDESLIPAAGVWLPVSVSVRDSSGNYDAYLSARVQALVRQPGLDELLGGPVDVEKLVGDAVERLLPRYQYRVIYGDEYDWINAKRIHVYNVQVYLQSATSGRESGPAGGFLDDARERLDDAATSSDW